MRRPAPSGETDLARERSRARAARRLLPFAAATVASGATLAAVAGAGWTGALVAAAPGLVFVLFAWSASVARCPACGRALGPEGGAEKGPGPARGAPGPIVAEPSVACPRCGRGDPRRSGD